MPVPTFVSAPRDGLPDIFETGQAMGAKMMFDSIDQIGWIIDENPGAHLIAHNDPLHDAPMYIRVDTDETLIDAFQTASFVNNEVAAVLRVFANLTDAQNETAALTNSLLVRSAAFNSVSGGDQRKVNYGWIGDSRTAYLIVGGIAVSSSVFAGYQLDKFHCYAIGEISRTEGDPGASVFAGGSDNSGGDASFVASINGGTLRFGGLTNSIASGFGDNAAKTFSNGASNRLGSADGQNDATSPLLSHIYIHDESNGPLRGLLPGILTPSLGMESVPEGIQDPVAITTKAGAANGIMVPMHNEIGLNDETAFPVYFDLTNDWDLYHAA